MYYEMNVSFKGQHFFATSERSGIDKYHASDVFMQLQKRFPASEGFEVTCTKWSCSGKDIPKDCPFGKGYAALNGG